MKTSAIFHDYALLLVWYPEGSTRLMEGSHGELIVNGVTLEKCYGHFKSKFDIPALLHQNVLYTPHGAIDQHYHTNCVVASSEQLDACTTCIIEHQFGEWNKASAISGLLSLSTDGANLGNCITTSSKPACSKF